MGQDRSNPNKLYTGNLNKYDTLLDGSSFTASFGEIVTTSPWSIPTKSAVDEFQEDWFSRVDITNHDIWICGGYRESLERRIEWTTWDVDYVITGPINSALETIISTGLSLGFEYNIWADVCHQNTPPVNYSAYDGTKVSIEVLRPYSIFRKEMNGKFFQVEHLDAVKIDNLGLYKTIVDWPSSKQLRRITNTYNWYQHPPLKINSAT
jgi:hypothetical protein